MKEHPVVFQMKNHIVVVPPNGPPVESDPAPLSLREKQGGEMLTG